MKIKYLIIPIMIYEGDVEIKGRKKINPLHPFILEVVVKNHNLEEIIKSFNIDKRLIQEAIVDLMIKEYVYVDLDTSLIYPSPEIEEAIDRGRLIEYLEDEDPERISLNWIQEMQSGQIMMLNDVSQYFSIPPNLKGRWIEEAEKLQLSRRNYINIQNLSTHILIKTAKLTLRTYIPEGEIFERVNKVYPLVPANNRYMYIPFKEETIENTIHTIPISETIPVPVIEAWTRSLTTLDAYSISDHSPADIEFLSQYHWHSLISKWTDINGEIGSSFDPKFSKKVVKKRFIKIYRNLGNIAVKYLLPKMMNLGLNVGNIAAGLYDGPNMFKKLESAFQDAKEMIIIGSSFINKSSLEKFAPLIENALNRDVKIIILWGLLGGTIQDIKQSVTLLNNPNILFINSKEKFHSKFLIIDNIHAWITSCNLCSYQYALSSATESICELKHGSIIGELIEYSMEKIEHIKALAWIKQLSEKKIMVHESVKQKEVILIKLQEIITSLLEHCDYVIKDPSNKEIIARFRGVFDEEKAILREIRKFETACLVENLENRRLLRASLLHAKDVIRIGTDRINRKAVGSVITASMNEAIKKGVPIQVRWGRESIKSIKRDDLTNIQKIINNINLETGNKIEISKEPAQSHAKFLTMGKNLLLLTSFNLLAFAGSGLSDTDITDELGVVISSQSAATEINSSFPAPKALPKLKKPTQPNKNKSKRKK